jgi:hypothetical protein
MNKKQEAMTAFKICEHMAELQSVLWDLYYEDFLGLINQQDDVESSKNDAPDIEYPF